jgi:hypothetical protein
MRMQMELCIELGIPVRDMNFMDVFLLAGRILQDDVVRKKALKYLQGSVLPMGSSKQAIQDMTDAERRALLERVYHRKP